MLMYMYMYCIWDLIFILFKTLQPGMEIQDFPEIGEWNFKNFENFLTNLLVVITGSWILVHKKYIAGII